MEVRITPDPEERDIVLAAVEQLLSRDPRPPAYRSGWREAGVRENLGDQDDAGLPRSNPGATRA